MAKLYYIGPHRQIETTLGDGVRHVVERGDALEMSDEDAAARADQPTLWAKSKPKPDTTSPSQQPPDPDEEE